MPIYMDVHIIPGVKAREVAEAHRKDMLIQGEHECKCMTYWIDEERENVFCLIEAPGKEAVEEMHHRAHGLIPHRIIEVSSDLVQSFLGRIYDPEHAAVSPDGLKVFRDSSFRILLVVATNDPVLMRNKWGSERTSAMLQYQNEVIRKHLATCAGTEVEYDSSVFVASFVSATRAISCAQGILNELGRQVIEQTGIRIGIHGGEPVSQSDELFGSTIMLARTLCGVSLNKGIAVSTAVRELVSENIDPAHIYLSHPQDERFLESLHETLIKYWQDPDFSIPDFCRALAMSKSQLYRKTIDLTGHSPNDLLKDYRLEKAKEMMKKYQVPVSQATFDSGFTSPSYFTKCFKKKFGMLPMNYLDLVTAR